MNPGYIKLLIWWSASTGAWRGSQVSPGEVDFCPVPICQQTSMVWSSVIQEVWAPIGATMLITRKELWLIVQVTIFFAKVNC